MSAPNVAPPEREPLMNPTIVSKATGRPRNGGSGQMMPLRLVVGIQRRALCVLLASSLALIAVCLARQVLFPAAPSASGSSASGWVHAPARGPPRTCSTAGQEDEPPVCPKHRPTPYALKDEHSGKEFLSGMGFWSAKDPQKGIVNYRNREDALALNLTYHDPISGSFYLQPDLTSRLEEDENRNSVRIETTRLYKYGLFVLDTDHMPTGCGTWPAFWMYDFPWPESGEIDIMEGVHSATVNRVALHTSAECRMDPQESDLFTGSWDMNLEGKPGTNCDVQAPDQKPNVGCGIEHPQSYGADFNAMGGGVYAAEWTKSSVSVYYFPRGCIPEDLRCDRPNPATWGKPVAHYSFGPLCDRSRMDFQHIVINLTFCGVWGDRDFSKYACERHRSATCADLVRSRPDVLKDAYWKIRSLKIYQSHEGLVKEDGHVGPHPGME